MVKHNELTEYHPAFIVAAAAPTTLSLGYPLRVGVEWLDTSGGIGVLRRCVDVDGAGVGTWVLDGAAVIKLPLGDADTPGGLLAWQNPEGADLILEKLFARILAAPTDPSHTADIGRAATGGTSSGDIVTGATLTATGLLVLDPPTFPLIVSSGQWITMSTSAGAAAGLAGPVYIYYHPA